jgi:diguanylate cyclase (GGDEF)-like protein
MFRLRYNVQSSFLITLIKFVARQSKPLLLVFSYLIICFIGIIDYLTGPEIALSIFYVVPVVLVVLSTNKKQGYIISFVAAAVWLVADLLVRHFYSSPVIPWWNAAVRFAFFALITNFASTFKKMYEQEETLARTDFLTGTANRRLLYETAQMKDFGPDATDRPCTVVYLDLDNFKKINDEFGHAVGDDVLHAIGLIIKQNLRKSDIGARIGGDEFVILLPGTGTEDSIKVAKKIKDKIIEHAGREKWPLTVTMGCATFLKPTVPVSEMISKADDLMYEAKATGKNSIRSMVWKE